MIFPVFMYGGESWTIKKAESWRIDAFELWCWRRLLRVPWTAKRSNQSILKEIGPGCSLEGLMLTVKLQYFGHLIWGGESFERPWCLERLRAGGEGDHRGCDGWMASPIQWTWVWVDSGVYDGQGGLTCCGSWVHKESDSTEWLNWTDYLHCPSEWICFLERVATTDLLNEGKAQFDSLPDKLQGMPAVPHCFR